MRALRTTLLRHLFVEPMESNLSRLAIFAEPVDGPGLPVVYISCNFLLFFVLSSMYKQPFWLVNFSLDVRFMWFYCWQTMQLHIWWSLFVIFTDLNRKPGMGPSVCNKGKDMETPFYRPLQSCIGGTRSKRWIPIETRKAWPSRANLNATELKLYGNLFALLCLALLEIHPGICSVVPLRLVWFIHCR